LIQKKLFYYLNGKLLDKKTLNVPNGIWYPAITINGINNIAILDPFSSK